MHIHCHWSRKEFLKNMEAAGNAANYSSCLHSPCAACKILRRRCSDKCALAPYFPPAELLQFTNAHRVFGASNIVKCLQELPDSRRADAVSSLVYEANARIRDPVYGSAGIVFQLQKQVGELEAQLARAQAELAAVQAQRDSLAAAVCMKTWPAFPTELGKEYAPAACAVDDYAQATAWEDYSRLMVIAGDSSIWKLN